MHSPINATQYWHLIKKIIFFRFQKKPQNQLDLALHKTTGEKTVRMAPIGQTLPFTFTEYSTLGLYMILFMFQFPTI